MAMESRRPRNDLTLALKYEMIETAEREKKVGVHKLGQMFSCKETQISNVLKNKQRIKEFYEVNASGVHREEISGFKVF